jgi:transposase
MDYETFHRLHFCSKNLGMNKEQIARSLQISSTTVHKWLKMERFSGRKYARRESKLDPFKMRIDELLKVCPTYKTGQIFHLLKSEGFTGGKTIVKDYLADIRPKLKKAFLTLNFPPGESAQVDWGVAGYMKIGDKQRKVSYFVMVLCHSRMMFVKFCLTEAQEAWNECHREAFEYFGGVPSKVMVDNCKTAVISHKSGENVIFNNSYIDLSVYYGFKIVACNVRQPQEKGRVENAVGYVRSSFLNGRKIEPFELLNIESRQWLDQVANVRIHGTTKRSPKELLASENLQKLPINPYDCTHKLAVKINKMYRVHYDSNTYSVPAEYVFEDAIVEVSTNKICISAKNRIIAEHLRCYDRQVDIVDVQHDRMLIEQRKRAEEQKMLDWLLKLSHQSEAFYGILSSRSLSPIQELRQLYALGQLYERTDIAQAIEDALQLQVCNAAYVRNILEQKERQQMGPLHISHKTDALKISLESPNLNIYEGR